MLLTELEDASQRALVMWGVLLFLVNICTVLLALVLQISEGERQAVLQLMLLEREVREAEVLLDATSLRADIAKLQLATGMSLAVPSLADVLPEMDDLSTTAQKQGAVSVA